MPRPPSPRPPGGVPAAWRGAWPEADVGATANLPRFYPEPRGRPRISQRRRVSHRFSLVIQTDNLLSIPSVSKFLITALVYRFRTLLSTLFPISSGSVFRGFWCTCVCDGVRSPLSIHPASPFSSFLQSRSNAVPGFLFSSRFLSHVIGAFFSPGALILSVFPHCTKFAWPGHGCFDSCEAVCASSMRILNDL